MEDDQRHRRGCLSVGVSAGLQDRGDGARSRIRFARESSLRFRMAKLPGDVAAASIRLPRRIGVRWRAFRRGLRWRSPQRVRLAKSRSARPLRGHPEEMPLQPRNAGLAHFALDFSMCPFGSRPMRLLCAQFALEPAWVCQTADRSERHAGRRCEYGKIVPRPNKVTADPAAAHQLRS